MVIRDHDFDAPDTTECAHCGGTAERVQGATYGAKAWDAIDYVCTDCGKGGHIAERSGRRAGPVFEGTRHPAETIMTDGGQPVEQTEEVEPVEPVGTQITTVRDDDNDPQTIVATVVYEAGDSRGELGAQYQMHGSTAVLQHIETSEGRFFVSEDPELVRLADDAVRDLPFVQAVTGFDRSVQRVETDGGRVASGGSSDPHQTDDEQKKCCPRCDSARIRYRKRDDPRGQPGREKTWHCKTCEHDFDDPNWKLPTSHGGIRGTAKTLLDMEPDDWPADDDAEVDG